MQDAICLMLSLQQILLIFSAGVDKMLGKQSTIEDFSGVTSFTATLANLLWCHWPGPI